MTVAAALAVTGGIIGIVAVFWRIIVIDGYDSDSDLNKFNRNVVIDIVLVVIAVLLFISSVWV